MKRYLARFARWLLIKTETDVIPHTHVEAPYPVFLPEPATCDRCGKAWSEHLCYARTVDGDVATCASCGEILPHGAVPQHTGAWLCLGCKGRITGGDRA